MNQTIVLYTNIAETRQNKRIEILKGVDSARKKLFKLKNLISKTKTPISIMTSCFPENVFKVVWKESGCVHLLKLYLPTSTYNQLSQLQIKPDYPLIALDFIYKAAQKEYNKLGERYNKIRSADLGSFKRLWW